jgi:SAM-dependent methyltransferase
VYDVSRTPDGTRNVLNSKVKTLAERLLPRFVRRRLDPVQAAIDDEAESLGRTARGLVLDAGAGEARHRRFFAPGRYLAIDRGTGDPLWDYSRIDVLGDLQHLPLRDSSVSNVLCMVVLEHTREPRKVLEEFGRVLEPGGTLNMVVPFLWEEHQVPNDYFRFTRYGVRALFEGTGMDLDFVEPMGGFFAVCARRSISVLGFFQKGWRWLLFVPLAPLFGLLLPLVLQMVDSLDSERRYTLAFRVRATRHARLQPEVSRGIAR